MVVINLGTAAGFQWTRYLRLPGLSIQKAVSAKLKRNRHFSLDLRIVSQAFRFRCWWVR